MLQPALLSLMFYLKAESFPSFTTWCLVNAAVIEVLGQSQGGLRRLKETNRDVWDFMCNNGYYDEKFLIMTPGQDETLADHKNNFQEYQRRYAILGYVMMTFMHDHLNVSPAASAIAYFKTYTKEREKPKGQKITADTQLLDDVIRVFILEALTQCMVLLQKGQGEPACMVLKGVADVSLQLHKSDHLVVFAG
jgi:hypothetical protein